MELYTYSKSSRPFHPRNNTNLPFTPEEAGSKFCLNGSQNGSFTRLEEIKERAHDKNLVLPRLNLAG